MVHFLQHYSLSLLVCPGYRLSLSLSCLLRRRVFSCDSGLRGMCCAYYQKLAFSGQQLVEILLTCFCQSSPPRSFSLPHTPWSCLHLRQGNWDIYAFTLISHSFWVAHSQVSPLCGWTSLQHQEANSLAKRSRDGCWNAVKASWKPGHRKSW